MKTFQDLQAVGQDEKARMDFILQAINEHKSSAMYQIAKMMQPSLPTGQKSAKSTTNEKKPWKTRSKL